MYLSVSLLTGMLITVAESESLRVVLQEESIIYSLGY